MKRLAFHSSVLLSFLLTLLGCSTLPKERPKDFSLRLSDNGGMLPIGYSIEINPDSSHLAYHIYQARNKVYFQLSEQELDNLYQQCVQQKFDVIKEHKEEVYDRGGTSIRLNVKGKDFYKSNSGMSFIRGKHSKRFSSVASKIRKLTLEKTNPLQKNIAIHVADSLLAEDTFLRIEVNSGGFHQHQFFSEEDGVKNVVELPFYVGDNNLDVNWMMNHEKKYKRKSIASNQFTVTISDNTQQLFLVYENGKIGIKLDMQ